MLFLCYPGCSTCAKAKAFWPQNSGKSLFATSKTQPPTLAEFTKTGMPKVGCRLHFLTPAAGNTALGLKTARHERGAAVALLATDGMLVRRPILVRGDTVLVGFRPTEWGRAL